MSEKNIKGDVFQQRVTLTTLVAGDSGETTVLDDFDEQMKVLHFTFAAGLSITHTVKLPPIGRHAGQSIMIFLISKSTASKIQIVDEAGNSVDSADLDADGDCAIYTCTGRNWKETYDGIA